MASGNTPGEKEKKAMEAKEQAKVATGGKADGGEEGAACANADPSFELFEAEVQGLSE